MTGLTVTPGDGQNTLTWDAVEGAVSYFLYYGDSSAERTVVRVADCGAARFEGITGTSYTHTGLSNGVSYTYNVTALDGNGVEGACGDNPNPVTGTPEAPKVYGCNHPDATNYDPTVTDYVPGSCTWPTPTFAVAPSRVAGNTTSRTISATIDEAGTGYCAALAAFSAAPTSGEVVANSNANVQGVGGTVAMTANATASCSITGLSATGYYDFYFVAKDSSGNLQATPTKASLTCPIGMVKFTGGTFTMGWSLANGGFADSPEHSVTLSDFCIDAKEVSQAEYTAWGGDGGLAGAGGYAFPGDNNPAEKVDWTNAQAYCVAQAKRLPTEAEWEYAARNGGTAPVNAYATGSVALPAECPGVGLAGANYNGCNGGGATITVGNYAASTSGLYDMAGNVWEWTGDWYDAAYYANGQVNPTGPGVGAFRVVRGGSWTDGGGLLRASFRNFGGPTGRNTVVGFRCSSN